MTAGQVLAEDESLELKTLQADLLNAWNDIELSSKMVKSLEPVVRQGAAGG